MQFRITTLVARFPLVVTRIAASCFIAAALVGAPASGQVVPPPPGGGGGVAPTVPLVGGGAGGSVGGVSINAEGALQNAEIDAQKKLHDVRAALVQQLPGDLKAPNKLRKVSLRRLEAAIAENVKAGKPLDDAVQCLAGLQNIRYILVYPNDHDIVLAGFGEGWKIDDRGNIVGLTTGRPVLLLDDLLVALRSSHRSFGGVVSCSIDPTADGLQRLREFVKTLSQISDPATTAQTIEQVMGPQVISIKGVPPTSHFARVLVAADYRMKRLGMGFDPSPVAGLPSYLQMMRGGGRGMQSMAPRWWMVPDFAPLLTDADGLSFEIRGSSVKTLTEETFFAENGSRSSPAGKTNPLAQRWADLMTAKYEDLANKEPIFAELHNCMDLAVVATLFVQRGLAIKAEHDFALLLDDSRLAPVSFPAPKQVDTIASFLKRGESWVLSASGGVKIETQAIVARTKQDETLEPVRGDVRPAAEIKNWWWN